MDSDAAPPPHGEGPVETAGAALDAASRAVVLVHGRGATAGSILTLHEELAVADTAYVAPGAAGRTWYPNSFLAPVASNEPGRSSGLGVISAILGELSTAGIQPAETVLLGFSQGACLATEFAARHPRRYGGVVGLSGGLIGQEIDPSAYDGDLAGTPVFLGCSDRDPHIPAPRVEQTGAILDSLGGDVDQRLYEGMGHTINEDERSAVEALIRAV